MQVDWEVVLNKPYYYFMEACNGGGCSYSMTASATVTLDPPSVRAKPGKAQITISWDAVPGARSYQIYRSENGGPFGRYTSLTRVNDTTYNNYYLTNGYTYSYYVTSSNSAGTSAGSNVASTAINLAAPLGVSAAKLNSVEVLVTWGAVPDADSYSVSVATNPNGPYSYWHDYDQSSTNTAALLRNTYVGSPVLYVYVTARNSAGYGPPSAVASTADGNNRPECCYAGSDPMLTGGPGVGSKGGSDGDPVNLATGAEAYIPEPDLVVYNPSGLSVSWRRSYHSYQALRGYGSPGFSVGWSHSYDIILQGAASAGTWGALNLVTANGGSEPLTPELDAAGRPTGVLFTRTGTPYLARGVPGVNPGEWESVSITWRDQTELTFTRHPSGLYTLGRVTNRLERGLSLTWNADRTLAQISDSSSGAALLALSYRADGRLALVADAYGRQVVYTYSAPIGTAPGRLEGVSQVGGAGATPPPRWTYTYGWAYGQQLQTISVPSPTGTGSSTATINYDGMGKVTSLVDANGNRRVIAYGAGSTQVQVKDAAGATVMSWTQHFSASRRDTGTVDANNRSTLREYNDPLNPLRATRVVDRSNKATSFTYDRFGNVLSVTTPRGVTTVYTYDYAAFALGRLTSVKEGAKPAKTFDYFEPSGLLKSVTSPSPAGSGTVTTSYTYDELGNVTSVTGPGNNAAAEITTTYSYTTDGSYAQPAKVGQPLTVTDNLGHVTHLRYDAQGRVVSRKDALGNESNASYNLAGQLEEYTYPATGQTGTGRARSVNTYLYAGGPLTAKTLFDESNVQARQVTYGYGAEGEPASVSGSAEPVTYTYDALYRLKTLKDGNNNTTAYSYDGVGNVSSVQMPGGETVQFPLHDQAGRVLRRIDGNGVTTDYLYDDPENLLTDIRYPASPVLNVHFSYDEYGRRDSMTDAAGSHTYTYGELDELKGVVTAYAGVQPMALSYEYYPNGSRKLMTTSAGSFSYAYDAAGRLTSLINPSSETTWWTYYDNNWPRTQQSEAGLVTTFAYNGRGQLTRLMNELGATTLSDFDHFAYDGAGNRKSYTADVPGYSWAAGSLNYEYDTKNQLKREQSTRGAGLDSPFGYDGAGNPTTFNGSAQEFKPNNQRAGADYAHDGNGNPTLYKGVSLAFDPENRLTAYGSTMMAGYRGDGLRAWKETAQGRTYFLYDGELPVLELDAAGAVAAVNTFGAAGLISRSGGPGAAASYGTSYYTFDPQGSVSQQISYDPLLEFPLAASPPLSFMAHGGELAGPSTPFGYGAQWGYYTDGESGLQLLTFRYYDPATGRFITRDPIGYRGGVNLYAYVANNPINYKDPRGLYADEFRCAFKQVAAGPWIYNELGGLAHALAGGLGASGGIAFNPLTQEICIYTKVCGRGGFGIFAGIGLKLGISYGDPPAQSVGGAAEGAIDVAFPQQPNSSVSTGYSASAGPSGVGYGVGPNLGAGISAGIDVCVVKAKCFNTPACMCYR